MILLLDIGNSRLKWATYRQRLLPASVSLDWHTHDRTEQWRKAWSEYKDIRRVLISNVASEDLALELTDWIQRQWAVTPEFVRVEAESYGVTVAYPEPGQFGVDRWLALIAAHRLHPALVCVADCGSAVTVDAMTEDGLHLGGMIMPGVQMMQQALLKNTYGIKAYGQQEAVILADNTADAVTAGCLCSISGGVDQVMAGLNRRFGRFPLGVLTGGDAGHIQPLLAQEFIIIPDLVLQGLAIVAENSK
jgi:type III pantothenate kinase